MVEGPGRLRSRGFVFSVRHLPRDRQIPRLGLRVRMVEAIQRLLFCQTELLLSSELYWLPMNGYRKLLSA